MGDDTDGELEAAVPTPPDPQLSEDDGDDWCCEVLSEFQQAVADAFGDIQQEFTPVLQDGVFGAALWKTTATAFAAECVDEASVGKPALEIGEAKMLPDSERGCLNCASIDSGPQGSFFQAARGPSLEQKLGTLHAEEVVELSKFTRDRSHRVKKPSIKGVGLTDGERGSGVGVRGEPLPPGGRRWTVLDMHALGHVMWTTAGLLWCRECGHYTTKVPKKLLEKCEPNRKASSLKWLMQGRHPDSHKHIGLARPLFLNVQSSACTGYARL